MRELMAFRDFERDEVFSCITGLINNIDDIDRSNISDTASWYCDCVAKMAAAAENSGMCGNIWNIWISLLFAECETPFALAQERRKYLTGTLSRIVREDIEIIFDYLDFDSSEGLDYFEKLMDY